MEHLRFKTYEDFQKFIKRLKYIGKGYDGVVYLLDNKWILKEFTYEINIEKIFPLLNLEIDGFAFPTCFVYVGDMVVGVIAPYVRGKDIYKKKLAEEKISKVIKICSDLISKIEMLSNLQIWARDVSCTNIIYDKVKLTVIDTLYFRFETALEDGEDLFDINLLEIMSCVIDSTLDNHNLRIGTFLDLTNSRYKHYYDCALLQNPRELFLGIKGELEEFIGQKIVHFSDAKEPLQRKLIQK